MESLRGGMTPTPLVYVELAAAGAGESFTPSPSRFCRTTVPWDSGAVHTLMTMSFVRALIHTKKLVSLLARDLIPCSSHMFPHVTHTLDIYTPTLQFSQLRGEAPNR